MLPRVLYMGTAELACLPLVALHASPVADVVGVVTQPDRPVGRKLKPRPSFVKQCALELGLPVIQPQTLRTPQAIEQLASFEPDLFVVTAFGQILPQSALDLPQHGALNVHVSLLPRHRGAAPIQWAILEGDAETGVTLMRMDAGLDTGDIISTVKTEITEGDTAQTLHDRLAQLGAALLAESLPGYLDGTCKPVSQDEARSTYARKILKQDGQIDWTESAETIFRKLRAFTPWPGIFTYLPTDKLSLVKIQSANISITEGIAGEVLSAGEDGILIGCGKQSLNVLQLQREGGRSLGSGDFLNGFSLRAGQKLS
ncbi:methionyl-tRNA formyltransferase [Verrucomicrobia bacterium]|nr:methionyl-tRNA formyltransferase [Verrucomicrobiota bacterium]